MTTKSFNSIDRITVIAAILLAAWSISILLAAWCARKIETANAVVARNNALAGQLAPALAASRSYDEALSQVILLATPDAPRKSVAAIIAGMIPQAQPDQLVETEEFRPISGLRMKTTTTKWTAIDIDALSGIISALGSAPVPHRLQSIAITPTTRKGIVEAQAKFITFTE